MSERVLVLGGIRSGKSEVGERLVSGAPSVSYLATALPTDEEMTARIDLHRRRRPAHWVTRSVVESSSPALPEALDAVGRTGAVLLDGLGGWIAARMHRLGAFDPDASPDASQELTEELATFWAAAAAHPGGPVVVVSEEAGQGLVPTDPGTRGWVDALGSANRLLADRADRCLWVVAGRVTELPPPAAESGPTPAEDLRAHGDTMIGPAELDFAVSVQEGPPPHVREAITHAAARASRYPDHAPAREAIAARHHRTPDEVLVTAGAAEGFWTLAQTLRAHRAAIVHPRSPSPKPHSPVRAPRSPTCIGARAPAGRWSPSASPPRQTSW